MLDDEEFKTRLKLLAESSSFSQKWTTLNEELIMGTYPFLNRRQYVALRWIIQTLWDLNSTVADHEEIVLRLQHREKQLFPSKKTINRTIQELCEKGVLKSEMSVFTTYNPDGVAHHHRVRSLRVPEKFRTEFLNALAELFKSTVDSYFSPRRKQ